MELLFNLSSATVLFASPTILIREAGTQIVVVEANDGTTDARDTFSFYVPPLHCLTELKEGINYESGDTSVTLVLVCTFKNFGIGCW